MSAYFFMHDMSWGWGVLMMIGWIALWALIIGSAWMLLRDRRHTSPDDVLKQRLAAGEIDLDEYDRLTRAISGPPATPPAAV